MEAFFLTNLWVNGWLLALLARSRGRVRWKRVIFGAGFAALYALAQYSGLYPQLHNPVMKLALGALLALIALEVEGWKSWLAATALVLGGTIFVAGVCQMVMELAGRSFLSLHGGIGMGCAALAAVLRARNMRLETWEAQVQVRKGSRRVRMTALIDTGNRLREPVSGLAVMLVEERIGAKLLPPEVGCSFPPERMPPGFRMVAFASLGGEGRLLCFRPDQVMISYGRGWLPAPQIWVAVYPGRLPGNARALAPAVMGRVGPAKGRFQLIGKEGSGA